MIRFRVWMKPTMFEFSAGPKFILVSIIGGEPSSVLSQSVSILGIFNSTIFWFKLYKELFSQDKLFIISGTGQTAIDHLRPPT